ncbi:regulatory protein RecX [Alicyclobacillus dauci]|uniref:Regulatory protein RecX n=1 Tax=Alicyclobacillus dauci TaxID=1475485 RepID=A0ABY6YZ32_9BACL|nr:RecX family transcriptional regulator [Alicyclobacillus dauci]WAH35339.1 RecX family transcriptional regulator [Alicyclobacillus dauci]
MSLTSPNIDEIVGREPVPGDPNAVRVLFHNEPPLVLSIFDWVNLGLKVNLGISEALRTVLIHHANILIAERTATAYLTGRVRTASQVRAHLERKGVSEVLTSEIVERLQRRGVIDDEQYALMYVEQQGERYSRGQLISKLRSRGIDAQTAKDAVVKALSSDVEYHAAKQAADKFVRRHGPLGDRKSSMKLMQYLFRRGFEPDLIRKIVQTLEADAHDE